MTIDLSRLPFPSAIEQVSHDALYAEFVSRFLMYWEAERVKNPDLPAINTMALESEPAGIAGQAFAYLRMFDRQRVNDAVAAVLAPTAKGANLDNIAASRDVQRLVIVPASQNTADVMETDAALLRRYLLSFGRSAAGSRDGLLYQAWTAWPTMGDARIIGHSVHGRRGDIDVVVTGPGGRDPTLRELALVREAVLHPTVWPEGIAVSVVAAMRQEYSLDLQITVPAGPDASLVKAEAVARVQAAAKARALIGGEIPAGLLEGAAYGPSIVKVTNTTPKEIAAHPYIVPVLTSLHINVAPT